MAAEMAPIPQQEAEAEGAKPGPTFAMVPYWLLVDARLTAGDKLLMALLYAHADAKSGFCWPNRKTLAKAMGHVGGDAKPVTKLLHKLQDRGFLKIFPGSGKTPSRYRLRLIAEGPPDRGGFVFNPPQNEPPTGVQFEPPLGFISNPPPGFIFNPRNLPTEQTKEPTKELTSRAVRGDGNSVKATKAEFEEWAAAYPKQSAVAAAWAPFQKARQLVTQADLMTATHRMAQAITAASHDLTMVPNPARWLTDRRWNDDLTVTYSRQQPRQPAGRSNGPAILEGEMFGGPL